VLSPGGNPENLEILKIRWLADDPRSMIKAVNAPLAGIQAASERLATSAHNIANTRSKAFRPLHSVQVEDGAGNPRVLTRRAAKPAEVQVAHELVDQLLAKNDAMASLRALDAGLSLLGSLLDTEA